MQEEAIRLRNDLRAVLSESSSPTEAIDHFDKLREEWPQRFWSWQ
jgi:hypothetical protein